MTDREQLVMEARQALHCLYIAVDESIADSVNRKVEAAFDCLLSLLPKEGEVVSDEMLNFLHGIGPLNGVHFGEKPEGERGQYWWRKQLPNARPK